MRKRTLSTLKWALIVAPFLFACGSATPQSYPGANTAIELPPPGGPPVWNSCPDPGFVDGQPDSYDLTQNVGDPDGDTLTITGPDGCTFPSGVTLDDLNDEIDYNGIGGVATATLCDLTADDGVSPTVNSNCDFTVEIAAAGGFSANTPSYTPVIRGAACFGCDVADWPSTGYSFYEVNSLSAGSTQGTLQHAMESSWTGCRIVYFSTSGTIDYNGAFLDIEDDCIFVAGQTAPSPGIVIRGAKITVKASNVYLGHLSCMQEKPASPGDIDCIITRASLGTINYIIYHNLSASFFVDEGLAMSLDANEATILQSISGWGWGDPFGDGAFNGRGVHIGAQVNNISILRNVLVSNPLRNPFLKNATGTVADNVVYNWGRQATMVQATATWNIEGNSYTIGPSMRNNEGIRIVSDVTGNVFWDKVGAGMNRGLNGMPDPPNENQPDPPFVFDTSRIASVFPTGYTVDGAGSTSAEEIAHVERVVDCAGPRPNDRLPLLQTLMDDVLSHGTDGSIISDISEVGGYPTLAVNTDAHADLPADPDAAGSPINAGVEWIMDQHDALMPLGRGCN